MVTARRDEKTKGDELPRSTAERVVKEFEALTNAIFDERAYALEMASRSLAMMGGAPPGYRGDGMQHQRDHHATLVEKIAKARCDLTATLDGLIP